MTQIQDLPSGSKIQQLVLGDLGVDREYTPPAPAAADSADFDDAGSSNAGSVPRLDLKIMSEDADTKQARERQQMVVGGTTVVDMTPRSSRPLPSARLEEDLRAVGQLADGGFDGTGTTSAAGAGADDGEEGGADTTLNPSRQHAHTDPAADAEDQDFGAPRMEDLTLTGKIGKFRYVHRFESLTMCTWTLLARVLLEAF